MFSGRTTRRIRRQPRLDLRELGRPLLLRLNEGVRGSVGERSTDQCAVRLGRLHELPQCRVALGDVEQVRRRAEDGLCAREAVERVGELARLLELDALDVEFAGGGAVGVVDALGVRGGRAQRQGEEGEDGEGKSEGAKKSR